MNNSNKFNEIAGIIGGIGPEATNYFTSLLVKLRQPNAFKDQEHIPYLVFSNPQIPDRTEFLLGGKESPLPELIRSGKLLKTAGASFLVMPCNTSHIFTEELEEEVGLEVLNMIELTAKYMTYTFGRKIKIGLLATDGTIKTDLYKRAFKNIAPETKILLPNLKTQKLTMKAIYKIKARGVKKESIKILEKAAKELKTKGAEFIILGCTEIPLALGHTPKLIDPMVILAQHVIEKTISQKTTLKKSSRKFWRLFPHP